MNMDNNEIMVNEMEVDEEIKNLLGEEIKSGIRNLSSLPAGSKEKSSAIEDLVKLYKLRMEEKRNELEERDIQMKKEQQIKDRYFKLGVEAAAIILPLIFYGIWMHRGFKFEESGTYTSTTFRNLFNRFKPTYRRYWEKWEDGGITSSFLFTRYGN